MNLDYKEIGRNIRRCRKERGLKQKELADISHISEQHMSHIENGYTQLSLATLVEIANALEVDCNTLLGETLHKARGAILSQELMELFEHMGNDSKKLQLRIELFRLLEKYGL